MTKINRFRFPARVGFLLLDSMISIVLISLSMLIFGRYVFSIVEHSHDAQLTLRALNVAAGLLDRCIHTKVLPAPMRQHIEPFSIECLVERRALPSLPKVQESELKIASSFTTVAITISFKTLRGKRQSYTLAGGCAMMQETA
jgi:hypothetical protein